jgi:hypothetical protein
MESDARVVEMFARLGLDARSVLIEPGDDGTRELCGSFDEPSKERMNPGAPGFGLGVPHMIGSPGFELSFARSGLGRRDDRFPFLVTWELELEVDAGPESAERLYGKIRDLIESMADASVEGFFVRVRLVERNGLVGHAVGVEFVRRPDRGAARIVVYDSTVHRDRPTYSLTRALIRGPLSAVASCPRCVRAMGWNPRARSGARAFAPAFALQFGDDEFCQTWIYVLYELRAEAGSAKAAAALASASDPGAMRRRLVEFVRRATRSGFAVEFWVRRFIDRSDGGRVLGWDFLRWLRWAAELPGFGKEYVADALKYR